MVLVSRLSLPTVLWATAGGVLIGIGYALSPATLCLSVVFVLLFGWAGRGLTARERRWVWGLLGVALALRVIAIAGFFLWEYRQGQSLAVLIPDDRHILTQSLRIRNLALGIPIAPVDYVSVYGEFGESGLHYAFALFQVLLGPARYGAHLLNTVFFLTGSVVLHRMIRSTYGRLPAVGGFAVILFLPSLFVWSISALKEPAYFLLTSISVAAAIAAVRASSWPRRALAIGLCVGAVQAVSTIRVPALFIVGGGLVTGLAARLSMWRAWLLVASVTALGFVAWFGLQRPDVQDMLRGRLQQAVITHKGHVNTQGHSYRLLDPRFYGEDVPMLTPGEAVRFAVRAAASVVLVPLPWNAASKSAIAFLPQQIIWYSLVPLAVIGFVVGLFRDSLVTCILGAIIFIGVGTIGLHGGNVGTLVRFRDMVTPLIVLLSVVGACSVLEWLSAISSIVCSGAKSEA